MDTPEALRALAALANPTRLAAFRLLIRQGPDGLPAGEIAEQLAVVPSTLSPHLAQLERAGLVNSWRAQRHIFYAASIEGTRRLLSFLTEQCCQDHPEICDGLLDAAALQRPEEAIEP